MSLTFRQVLLLVFAYSMLAVAWGWRLHANDTPPAPVADASLDTTRTSLASSLAHAPRHLQGAAIFQLVQLPEQEVKALQSWQKALPEQRVRQLTVQHGPLHAPSPLNTALLFVELSRADAPLIDDSRLFICAAGDRIDETDRIEALEFLAAQALKSDDLNLAVAIHERVCESTAATWQNVLHLTEAARISRRPAAALRVVNEWLGAAQPRLDEVQREAALDLQLSLLLEGSRYAEASRICLDALRALKPAACPPPRLMERALLATRAAGESAELLPWIELHLRSCPDHLRTVQNLASGKAVDPGYRRWLNEGAGIADLNHQTSIACDLFFRLAALGETRVLARLHTLTTQMGRGREFSSLLAALQPRFSPLQLARALADGGAPAAAHAVLAPCLESSPDDRAGWRLLTEIGISMRGKESAAMLWEHLLQRFPDDVPALLQLARLQIEAEQHPQALRTLLSVPEGQRDEPTLRQIVALAMELDDIPAAHRARQLIISSSSHPAIGDVVALTITAFQHPDAAAVEAAQGEALARLPAGTEFHRSLTSAMEAGEALHFTTAAQPK